MQEKVAVRVNDLVAQCIWHSKRPAIDQRTRRGGSQTCEVTDVTPYRVEKRGSGLCTCGRRQPCISGWRLGRSHEARKDIDIAVLIFPTTNRGIGGAWSGVGSV